MKFATALEAPKPRSDLVRNGAWLYGGLLIIMAVGQLFSFEKFIPLIEDYQLAGGHGTAVTVAAVIVVTEVFALPFLLRMRLSPLMRWVSLFCGVVAAILWLLLGFIALGNDNVMTNSGLLGTKIAIPVGWPQVVWALIMTGLASWSAWGLWPLHKKIVVFL